MTGIASFWRADRRFEPAMVPAGAEAIRTRGQGAVARSHGWIAA